MTSTNTATSAYESPQCWAITIDMQKLICSSQNIYNTDPTEMEEQNVF